MWSRRGPAWPFVVSIHGAPAARRRGFGPAALLASMRHLPPRTVVHAIIRQNNRASIVAFQRADFEYDEAISVGGVDAVRYATRVS